MGRLQVYFPYHTGGGEVPLKIAPGGLATGWRETTRFRSVSECLEPFAKQHCLGLSSEDYKFKIQVINGDQAPPETC